MKVLKSIPWPFSVSNKVFICRCDLFRRVRANRRLHQDARVRLPTPERTLDRAHCPSADGKGPSLSGISDGTAQSPGLSRVSHRSLQQARRPFFPANSGMHLEQCLHRVRLTGVLFRPQRQDGSHHHLLLLHRCLSLRDPRSALFSHSA